MTDRECLMQIIKSLGLKKTKDQGPSGKIENYYTFSVGWQQRFISLGDVVMFEFDIKGKIKEVS